MKITTTRKNILIGILVSLVVMLGAVFGVIFAPKIEQVDADTYNPGVLNEAGYYTSNDGVVFYAVKVTNASSVNSHDVVGNIFTINVVGNIFTINGVEYTYDQEGNKITYGTDSEISVDSGEHKTFLLNGITYTLNFVESVLTTVSCQSQEYWPTYNVVMNDGHPAFIQFGETVSLQNGEMILLCFGRQSENAFDDNGYISDGSNKISASVDFLTGVVSINGTEQLNCSKTSTSNSGELQQEFGYIINPNDLDITGEGVDYLLGTASSTDNEGLIEFSAEYQLGEAVNTYSFMFYAFRDETYERTEDLNIDSTKHFSRPAPEFYNTEYVTDSTTSETFFSEHFYYYATQNLPYIEYDYTRYEVDISKSIHTTNTTYHFGYDVASENVIQNSTKNPSTADIYAQLLNIEQVPGTTLARIYFSDLGVYDVEYTAVYYNQDGSKVELDTINNKYAKQDRLTIYGTQMTYQDIDEGTSAFYDFESGISANITSSIITGAESVLLEGGRLDYAGEIASTNQPQVSMLFNSTVQTSEGYEAKIYYSTDGNSFTLDSNYSYTSNFINPGYYLIQVTNKYANYKIWLGSSTQYSSQTPKTQVYLFQIKDQTPDLNLYKLQDNGEGYASISAGEAANAEILTGVYNGSTYTGSYVKNGVQIFELEERSVFDSATILELKWRTFAQSDSQMTAINLNGSAEYLAGYGITKDLVNGYYKVAADGHYSISLKFGKSGVTTCYFDIDNEAISGINAYTVSSTGLSYYKASLLASQGEFVTTDSAFSLLWNNKASGAKITAKYVRYDMTNSNYLTLLGGETSDNDYIVNSTWLASDYSINLASSNPATPYAKAGGADQITASHVNSLDGLYIFKLTDEAGNIAFYAIVVDSSIPTVLQKPESGASYTKVMGINNVSEETTVFFGSQKAIPFTFDNLLLSTTALTAALDDDGLSLQFREYFGGFVNNLSSFGAVNSIRTANEKYFLTVPITKVLKVSGGVTTALTSQQVAQGSTVLIPELDANDRMKDGSYTYQIFDDSNSTVDTPSRAYSIRVNTDSTRIAVVYNGSQQIYHTGSQTADDYSYRTNFYRPVNVDKLYLTWGDLRPTETINAYVDLADGGLICNYYPLVYSENTHSYSYSTTPVRIALDFDDIDLAEEQDGTNVRIAINFSNNGVTYAGKYEIVRTYKPVSGEDLGDLGNDFPVVTTVFFVDRTPIISASGVGGEQTGYYTYLTMFDGGSVDKKIQYNSLYQQSQFSENSVLETNKLPIGLYIPISKYGTTYALDGTIPTETILTKNDIQTGTQNYKFVDLVTLTDLDGDVTINPYALTVKILAPNDVIYYYSYADDNGYFLLSGYSINGGETIVDISNGKAFVENNPITNNGEWATGSYKIVVSAIKQEDNSYLQNFYFKFNVVTTTPAYTLTAEYPTLNNMDAREIQSDGNFYYTNTNQITVSWRESQNAYLTKIDLNSISYTYYIDSRATTVNSGVYTGPIEGTLDRSFTITLPDGVTYISITMSYEVYSTDTTRSYRKYYEGGRYTGTKTINIDMNAPTNSIAVLINADDTVKGQNPALLRESDDTRYNKTITTGTYRYYSFASSVDFVTALAENLLSNTAYDTKCFYLKSFAKYTTSTIYETGLGLDSSSISSNVFSEYYALSDGWKKVTKLEDIPSTALDFGYYEIIEMDLAGNMSIYTVYITNNAQVNVSFTQKLSAVETQDDLILSENNSIISYDFFNLESISFGSYRYMRFTVDNVAYLVTPFGYTNIGTAEAPNLACTQAVRLSDGEVVDLDSLRVTTRDTAHQFVFADTVNKTTRTLSANVVSSSARIADNGGVDFGSDLPVIADATGNLKTFALIVKNKQGASLTIDENSLLIYEIYAREEDGYKKYGLTGENLIHKYSISSTSTGYVTTYYYINYEDSFDTSTFYVVFKDNFGNEYLDYLKQYNTVSFNQYEGNYDITNEMQNSDSIIVSGDVSVNVSNLYDFIISAKDGMGEYSPAIDGIDYSLVTSALLDASYKQFRLVADTRQANGYRGGAKTFKFELSSNIPDGVVTELTGDGFHVDTDGATKTLYVTIYNEVPIVKILDSNGVDITTGLFNKTITQSEPITLTFSTASDLADNFGYEPKVFLRLRTSGEDYRQITSPVTVGEPGVYDIYVQNFSATGELDYVWSGDFVISDLDVLFYTVVKTNAEGEQEIVSATGKVFSYQTGNSTTYVPYHYIVNTDEYRVITNGTNVTVGERERIGTTNTYLYTITSTSGTMFRTTIAVTVVPQSDNILGTNGFIYYFGTSYVSPTADSYINSTSKDVYLCKGDAYNEVTLRWNSYYNDEYNKIVCYISSDAGSTWTKVDGTPDGSSVTLMINKSGNYLFKFVDYAGNTQTFSSSSGYLSESTQFTFIRSVIFKVNDDNQIDNAIYNDDVTISLPSNTLNYYSSTPIIKIFKDNVEYVLAKDKDGNYVFTESGTYTVSFAVKVRSGTKDLNEDSLTFTIVNKNDSRWAFNYNNYNDYDIEYIKYNGVLLSTAIRKLAVTSGEINISAFLKDSLGNRYFDNGIYTIKMVNNDNAFGEQSFEFDFWLNDAVPPISVSLAEGSSTTGSITVKFNTANLYEILGDCYVMINNKVVSTIDETSTQLQEIKLSEVRSYYIQVYTSSGKLVYSYHVEITEPLNTVTIILIVVACVVVLGTLITVILLRKKIRVR